ncbi:hypothetical protein HanRHA438_Chr02g0058501 [Helianthus annuus]|nr:hypothetical protein HanRHA438_Chr02g0058501 [Helianthus annuus]
MFSLYNFKFVTCFFTYIFQFQINDSRLTRFLELTILTKKSLIFYLHEQHDGKLYFNLNFQSIFYSSA